MTTPEGAADVLRRFAAGKTAEDISYSTGAKVSAINGILSSWCGHDRERAPPGPR